MKKISFLLTLAVALLGAAWANAATVSPYTMDFNKTISTSAHNFKVGSSWGHIVSSYYDDGTDYYVTYYYNSYGVDDTGCLRVGDQTSVGDSYSYGSTGTTTDLLVTPAITGTASIKVKKYGSNGTIKFYTCTLNGSTYTKGDEITVELPSLYSDSWTTVTIPAQQGAYVGIWASNVYIDDFTAESAEVEPSREITILKVTRNTSNEYVYCDEQGNYDIPFTVQLTNTGEQNFNVGDEDYYLELLNYVSYTKYDTLAFTKYPIPQAMAVGDTITVQFVSTLNYANYPKRDRFDVMEGASLTVKYGAWFTPVPYIPKIVVRNENGYTMDTGNGSSTSTSFGSFGMISEDVTKTFIVGNDGGAPFTGTIEAPTNFTVSKTALSLAAGARDTITLTALATTPGINSGDLKIISSDTTTWYVTLSSIVRDLSRFYEDFEGNRGVNVMPDGWWDIDNKWEKTTNTGTSLQNYASATLAVEHIFSTPLLKINEGEKMSFDASKKGNSSFINVYYSTDRKNWTLVKEVATSELGAKAANSYSNPTYNSIVVDGIPAGNYYIGFGSGYALIDNVYGYEAVPVAQDIVISDQNISTAGKVNNEFTPTVTLYNLLGDTVAADGYTVGFYFNGEKVADCTTAALPSRTDVTLNASFTPHEEGTFPAYFMVTLADGSTRMSDTVDVTIAAEGTTMEYTVGTAANNNNYAPLSILYKNSVYESLYKAEQLAEAGLKAGDKISSLTYHGYFTAADSWDVINTKFFIMNCEDTIFGDADMTPDADMTEVFNGTVTISKAGSSSDYVPIMTITFNEPFTYTGKALRIKSQAEQNSYKSVYFAYDSSIPDQTVGNRSDGTKVDAFTEFTYKPNLPVTTFGVDLVPDSLSGIVTDSITGAPLAGVNIELNAVETTGNAPRCVAQVKYSGTTDENGKYAIAVVQNDKTYEVTYSLEGYNSKTLTLTTIGTTNVALAPIEKEAENIYVIKAIEGNTWNLSTGELMNDTIVNTDSQLILAITNLNLAAVNGDKGYLGFTTKLASADDAWTEISEYRLGPVSEETNFVANNYINTEFDPANMGDAQYITMVAGDKFIQAPAATYDLYLELTPASSEAPIQPMSVAIAGSNMRLFMVNPNSTGVTEMPADLGIASVKYYDLNGVELAEPTTGVNIRVITYDNGTTRAIKVLK